MLVGGNPGPKPGLTAGVNPKLGGGPVKPGGGPANPAPETGL